MNSNDPSQASSSGDSDEGVERLLAAFAPRRSRLDRDRLMFLAGRAAAERDVAEPVVAELSDVELSVATPAPRGEVPSVAARTTVTASDSATAAPAHGARTPWYWPAATAVSTMIAAALGGVLLVSPPSMPTGAATTVAAPRSPADVESPHQDDAPSGPLVAASNPPSAEVAPQDEPTSAADLEATPLVWPLRAAVSRGELDEPSSLPSTAGDADPPSTYLRAVRSVINRPQSLSLELRY